MKGGFPGGNIQQLMKQAQEMQKKMVATQEEMGSKTVEATAGGGAIKVVVSGKKEIKEIVLNKDIIDPDDVEMLQDLIIACTNEALRKAEDMMQGEMGKLTGGMNIPGF